MGFYFGELDNRLKERITIRLDKQLLFNLKSRGQAPSHIIRAALTAYLKDNAVNNCINNSNEAVQ